MQTFSVILFWLAMGAATAYFANQRGRDPFAWFMWGMLLGFFGLLLLFVLPPLAKEEEPGLEAEYSLLEPNPKNHDYFLKEWYYYDDKKEQHGPVRFEQLKKLWEEGHINEETFVWHEGLDNWKQLQDVEGAYAHLRLEE